MCELLKNSIISFFAVLCFTTGFSAQAQIDDNIWGDGSSNPEMEDVLWGGQKDEIQARLGLDSFDPRVVIANIINIAMGFIGIIMIIMFMLAGFKIMLAGGNEDAMTEAKKMIWGTVVGTFIIFASFSLAKFFIGSFVSASVM